LEELLRTNAALAPEADDEALFVFVEKKAGGT
jgi:hypothetical protein